MLHRRSRWSWRLVAVSLSLLLPGVEAVASDTLFVDDDAPGGGDGQSWATAFRHLQDALSIALLPNGEVNEIRVAQGVYRPDRSEDWPHGSGDRLATFQLVSGVALRGGYAGLNAADSDERDIAYYKTTLSGDLKVNDSGEEFSQDDNAVNVVTGSGVDPTAVLEGFNIRGGHADGDREDDLHLSRGAGMWNLDGSPTVLHCEFVSNCAEWNGGGMYNYGASFPLVRPCRFVENVAVSNSGGAMFLFPDGAPGTVVLESCEFERNRAGGFAGGIRGFGGQIRVRECLFRQNDGGIYGSGGAMALSTGVATLENCHFAENHAGWGGALALFAIRAQIQFCTVEGNLATQLGGGLALIGDCDVHLVDSEMRDNSTETRGVDAVTRGGGAIHIKDSALLLERSEVLGNATAAYGGGIHAVDATVEIRQSRIQANVAKVNGGGLNCENSELRCEDSDIQGNVALKGGGVFAWRSSAIVVTGGWVADNVATFDGGFLRGENSDVSLHSLRGTGNVATTGGAVSIQGSTFDARETLLSGNVATMQGGAIHALFSLISVENSLLAHNTAAARGGGVAQSVVDARYVNCTFVDNTAAIGPDIATNFQPPLIENELLNCIFWGEAPDRVADTPSPTSVIINSTLRDGWSGPGSGHVDEDPLFIDPDGPDDDATTLDDNAYQLSVRSPAIDAGDNDLLPEDALIDLAGRLRVLDGDHDGVAIVDMGAFEFFPDCNGNGILDDVDLSAGPSTDCNGNRVPDECDIPVCLGRPATIYVDPCGIIVGGPLEGLPYFGVLIGTPGDDVIAGTDGPDHIVALRGDDLICGGAGDDHINANHGDDTIDAGAGHDNVHGGSGRDRCVATERASGCEIRD